MGTDSFRFRFEPALNLKCNFIQALTMDTIMYYYYYNVAYQMLVNDSNNYYEYSNSYFSNSTFNSL